MNEVLHKWDIAGFLFGYLRGKCIWYDDVSANCLWHECQGIRESGLRLFSWSKATGAWRERVEWVRRWEGEQSELPDVSDDALLRSLETWLAPFLAGVRTNGQLQAVDVNSAVR
jgi:hypothetical protein